MLASGTRLGPYEIQSAIGSGGMGEVYKARDTRLERAVAIKVLSPLTAEAAHVRERFEREARAISRLSHPHICTLYDVGEDVGLMPSGAPLSYLVMELLEGETLAQRLERGPLPLDQVITFAAQIADALDKAHRANIVHGDLKPGNIMVTKAGVKLLDFGLAIERHRPPPAGWAEAVTSTDPAGTGAVVGTLQYLAPEQLEGRQSDERTDIFACGLIFYEMATGRKAFDGHSQAGVIAAIMRHDPPSIASLRPTAPPALDHVVAACLAKDPDERWQHAGDLARELTWIAAVGSKSDPALARLEHPRHQWMWMTAAAVFLLTTLALAAWLYVDPGPPDTPAYRTSILLPEGLRFTGAGGIGGSGRFAISPDGRRMAFVAVDPNGNQRLWVRPLESLVAAPLDGTDGASSPFWSPDSRLIAFVAQGQLKTVDPAGGAPAVIATAALNATGAWSRENVILFTPTIASSLYSVPASGGVPRPVTTLDKTAGDVLHRNPSFLPDGRHFLYVSVGPRNGGTIGPRTIYVASLDPDEPTKVLLESGSNAKYSQGHVILVRENVLLAQPFDVNGLAVTGEPRPVAAQVELIGPASAAFTVSDTGVLAYQPSSEGSHLVWFDREGRQLGTVGDPAGYGDLELSPDGRRAAVSVLDQATNTRDLWIVEIERGVRTRFTFDPSEDVAPAWSPDGARIAFASNRGGHFDVFQKAASGVGSEEIILADASEKYPTSWTPDGLSLLYWGFDPASTNTGLFVLPLAGEEKPSRFLGAQVSPGRLSPDGRFVAYYSSESGRPEVYVVPFPDASRKWQVSSAGGSLSRWRSDGKEIFYAGRDNRLMSATIDVKGAELEVGQARSVFEARPVGPRSFYDVAPDGSRFLVNSLGGESPSPSITIIQNWSAAPRP